MKVHVSINGHCPTLEGSGSIIHVESERDLDELAVAVENTDPRRLRKMWTEVLEHALIEATWPNPKTPEVMRHARAFFLDPLWEEDFLDVCALANQTPARVQAFARTLFSKNLRYRRRND